MFTHGSGAQNPKKQSKCRRDGILYFAKRLDAKGGFVDVDHVLKKVVDSIVPFLSSAVRESHANRIVYFDLKPSNILRCGNIWKLGNFHLTELLEDGQTRNSGEASDVVDLYFVGVIMYTIVTQTEYVQGSFLPDGTDEAMAYFIQQLLENNFSLQQFYDYANQLPFY